MNAYDISLIYVISIPTTSIKQNRNIRYLCQRVYLLVIRSFTTRMTNLSIGCEYLLTSVCISCTVLPVLIVLIYEDKFQQNDIASKLSHLQARLIPPMRNDFSWQSSCSHSLKCYMLYELQDLNITSSIHLDTGPLKDMVYRYRLFDAWSCSSFEGQLRGTSARCPLAPTITSGKTQAKQILKGVTIILIASLVCTLSNKISKQNPMTTVTIPLSILLWG